MKANRFFGLSAASAITGMATGAAASELSKKVLEMGPTAVGLHSSLGTMTGACAVFLPFYLHDSYVRHGRKGLLANDSQIREYRNLFGSFGVVGGIAYSAKIFAVKYMVKRGVDPWLASFSYDLTMNLAKAGLYTFIHRYNVRKSHEQNAKHSF